MKKRTLILLLSAAAAVVRAEDGHLVADFDRLVPDPFVFKDNTGSLVGASAAYKDPDKGGITGIQYKIVGGGWGGWGLPLKALDVQAFRYLSFAVKGQKGSEIFEVGLRDTAGVEKKVLISSYADISTAWQTVRIPLADFRGVNATSLDNLTISFTEKSVAGRFYLDAIQFDGKPTGDAAAGGAVRVNKSLVDGFERTTPSDAFQVVSGDDSTLALTSSRAVYEGDYAMQMEYKFSTSKPWGSSVGAIRHFKESLDWSGARELRLWVKGDGSDNDFRFRVTDSDGDIWEFIDRDVLRSLKWVLVSLPFEEFKRVSTGTGDGRLDVAAVRSYEMSLSGEGSQSSGGAKITAGRVFVDQLYLVGENLRALQSAPAGTVAQLRQSVPGVSNVDFTMVAFTEYFFTPEQKSQVNHYAKLIANAKAGNFSAKAEIGSVSQEFGAASSFVGLSTQTVRNVYPELELPNFQVMVNNISPALTNVTLGNVFVDYTPYTFTADFGLKGATVEGDWSVLNYHGFAIKHALNSFTAGSRVRAVGPHSKLTLYSVYSEENARLADPSVIGSGGGLTAANSAVLRLRRATQDMVYNVEGETRFWQDRLSLKGLYGYNNFARSAQVDYSDPFSPAFVSALPRSIKTGGGLLKGTVQSDGFPWRGATLAYSYRDVGTGYKPRFRQIPVYFDDTDSDQWAHNYRVSQARKGWILSGEFDDMTRNSNRNYYRHKALWGVGRYGYKGLDIAFNQEYRRERYVFVSDRSSYSGNKNEKIIISELYLRAQLSPRTAYWVKPRQDRIWHPATNANFVADSLQMKFEFYINSNARFFAEHKKTRFDNVANEPLGFPYDDNFTRVSFEVTF